MKIKIMQSKDAKIIETAYNEFESNNNVHFTQSHVDNAVMDGANFCYFSLYIYYTEKKIAVRGDER